MLSICMLCMHDLKEFNKNWLAFPAQGTNQTQAISPFQPYFSTRLSDFFPRWILTHSHQGTIVPRSNRAVSICKDKLRKTSQRAILI